MTDDSLLQNFICDEYYQWCKGEIFVPFWGSMLPVTLNLDLDTNQADAGGVEMLRAIVAYDGDFRTPFINAAFEYYTNRIHGSFVQYDCAGNNITHLVAPHITEPDQIWPMLKEPSLVIHSYKPKGTVEFSIRFKCQWDEEHGFGARYVDWELIRIGGADA